MMDAHLVIEKKISSFFSVPGMWFGGEGILSYVLWSLEEKSPCVNGEINLLKFCRFSF